MRSEWYDILDRVKGLYREAKDQANTLWFRGQTCSGWPLRSTLHRHVEEQCRAACRSDDVAGKQQVLREEYKSLFYSYWADAVGLLAPNERNDWGIVFSMQHHGWPTRLLDWTESFICALFFAQFERRETEDAAVFVLNPERLNTISNGREGLVFVIEDPSVKTTVPLAKWLPAVARHPQDPPLNTVALFPPRSNPRMISQRATFTVCGDSLLPLEEEYNSCITKIELPASLYGDAEAFLEIMGIGPFSYFPDFEGLSMLHRHKRRLEMAQLPRWLSRAG